jgi:hypothetical protein
MLVNLGDPLGSEASTVHNELERPVEGVSKCEPWDRVVADVRPCDHTVPLGRARIFAAVCRFAGVARERRGLPSGASVRPLERDRPTNTLFGIALQRASVRWHSRARPRNMCKPGIASHKTRGGNSSA